MDQVIFHLINELWTNPASTCSWPRSATFEIWKPRAILWWFMRCFHGFKGARLFFAAVTLFISEQISRPPFEERD